MHAGFTFDDAAALVPYLAALGVSHLYCSPVLQAAPGSTHGYDVVDHGRLSDDLGGAAGFERLLGALAEHGLGAVLDTVPNHMALAGSANRWWWDVLEDGPASRYAGHFDIDWTGHEPGAGPSVLMPILGDHLGRVIEAGELGLAQRGGAFVVTYHDQELPLSPRSLDDLLAVAAATSGSEALAAIARDLGALPHAARTDPAAVEARHRGKADLRQGLASLVQLEPAVGQAIDAELAAVAADPDVLEALLDRQNYRLAHWRVADEELDYRRFFSITTLVGVRVEDEEVFRDSHRLIGELLERDEVSGLRIDHVDGLRHPAQYLDRLRGLAPGAYVVVEKILQPGESLPDGWPVQGTSGYDHLVAVDALFVDTEQQAAATERYVALTGDDRDFPTIEHEAKHDVMAGELAAETERLTTLLAGVCARHRRHRDHTRRDLREALREVVAGMGVYRTYVVPGDEPAPAERAQVAAALASAKSHRPDLDAELLELIGRSLLLGLPGDDAAELAVRFQQLSAPVMAKGVEDTAFYRYHRLVSLNEVGGDPGTYGRPLDAFHEHCGALARSWPDTMLTRSTHDTKRSGDVRARISLLSELPAAWGDTAARWMARNERHRRELPSGPAPDAAMEVLLYQTLVGVWPIEVDRLRAAMYKSAKEAKIRTSWTSPDPAYDEALGHFVDAVLADRDFVADLEGFLAEHRIVELGRRTSLSQLALVLTSPGVPDLYQGTELEDRSLVDPDNRRPVDFDARRALLADLRDADAATALGHPQPDAPRLWMIARLLRHRRQHPDVHLAPRHAPLPVEGPRARHAVAFERGRLAVVAPRLLVGLGDDWQGTTVALPAPQDPQPGTPDRQESRQLPQDRDTGWVDLLSGRRRDPGEHLIADLLADFTVAVLAAQDVA